MHCPVIVEFTGIAGSGKTSISQAVVGRLESRGFSVGYGPRARGRGMRLAAIRRPRAAYAWMRTIRRVFDDPSVRREHRHKMYTLLGRIVSLADENQVVVMDEGIIHRFRALRRDSGVEELSIAEAAKPLSVASLFPLEPSLLVLVQSDAEITGSRLLSRDGRHVGWTSSGVRRGDDRSLRDIDQMLAVFPDAAMMLAVNRVPEDVSLRAGEIVARVEGILANRP